MMDLQWHGLRVTQGVLSEGEVPPIVSSGCREASFTAVLSELEVSSETTVTVRS